MFMNNDDKIKMIMTQTNYNEEQAKEKLLLFHDNEIHVIKDYMNIEIDKKPKMTSVNQEIYKQIRHKLYESLDKSLELQYKQVMEEENNITEYYENKEEK